MGWVDRLRGGPAPSAAAHVAATQLQGDLSDHLPERRQDVWQAWRLLGELNFVTTAKARKVAQGRFDITVDGRIMPEAEADQVIEEVTGPDGPRIVVAMMALHFEVAGTVRYGRLTESGHWHVLPRQARDDRDRHDVLVTVSSPDPADPKKVTSPVIAALGVIRELILLGNLGRAQARSRVSQRKILLTPTDQELRRAADAPAIGVDIVRAFTAPIADEHSAAAVAPLRIGSPVDLADGWRVLDLTSQFDADLPDRVDHLLRRLALSMDYPPEKLLGNLDSNHWNAWLSTEDAITDHVEPAGWLPARVFEKTLTEVLDGATVEVDYVPPVPTHTTSGPGGTTTTPKAGAPAMPDVAAVASQDLGEALARIDERTVTAGRAMVEAAIGRARERAGAKVRTAVRSDPVLTSMVDGVDNGDVVATVGMDVAAIHLDRDRLADQLGPLASQWSGEVDRAWQAVTRTAGVVVDDVAEDRDASARLLTTQVADHVWQTLGRRTSELPAPPMDAVRQALIVAGGSGGPTVETASRIRPGEGLAVGRRALAAIEAATGLKARQWRWSHDAPEHPFPPHVALNGRFTTPDGDVTATMPERTLQDGEVRAAYEFNTWPGQHSDGCLCTLAPVFS